MKLRHVCTLMLSLGITLVSAMQANALSIDLIEGADDPVAQMSSALLDPVSGVTIVGGSGSFIGRVGDGSNPNTAQSGIYTSLSLTPNNGGLPLIENPNGIFLTSGVANISLTGNGDTSFDNGSTGTSNPGTGSDADLAAILSAAGAPSSFTTSRNIFEFDFTVEGGANAVEARFVFGSDEFPDQGVTDIFAFIVDGENFAVFPDGSLISFVTGVNASNFNNNNVGTGNYNIEYDGISNSLRVVGVLNSELTTHHLKLAIADTSDTIFDSGVFIGGFKAINFEGDEGGGGEGGGGIIPDSPIPEPSSLALLGLGTLGLFIARRRRQK
ncbi:MAG: choice-of-anchor L domain-containing protein [Planctomycetaceae bacterium]